MKEIQAYQSDDGSFVGTKEQVLEYEKKQKLEHLYDIFSRDSTNYGESYVLEGEFEMFIDFAENNEYFKDFIKMLYDLED